MTDLGKSHALLAFDISSDGFTVAAGTELQGDEALVLYWFGFHTFSLPLIKHLP
jgi:hypothetical protein